MDVLGCSVLVRTPSFRGGGFLGPKVRTLMFQVEGVLDVLWYAEVVQ